jgi:hypothetical protein
MLWMGDRWMIVSVSVVVMRKKKKKKRREMHRCEGGMGELGRR